MAQNATQRGLEVIELSRSFSNFVTLTPEAQRTIVFAGRIVPVMTATGQLCVKSAVLH